MDNAQKQPADAVGSSEGLGLAPKRTMRLHRVEYVEAPAPAADNHPHGVCRFCALFKTTACAEALDGVAEGAFGGDCETNDVVYRKA